jgi:hypothetical protein
MCPHLDIFLHNVESLAIKKCKSRHIKNPNTNTNVAIPAYPMPTEESRLSSAEVRFLIENDVFALSILR